jgi:hypothetical protein
MEFKRADVLNLVQQCVNKHLSPTESYIPQNPLIEFTERRGRVFHTGGAVVSNLGLETDSTYRSFSSFFFFFFFFNF